MNNVIDINKQTHSEVSVLVVDDDPFIAQSLNEFLDDPNQNNRIKITQLTNSREAINTVRDLRPDVVLLDYEMPGLNGLQVMDKLNKLSKKLRPRVIFLTAYYEYRNKALEAGAIDYLVKEDIALPEVVKRINYVTNTGEQPTILDQVADRFYEEINRTKPFIKSLTETVPEKIIDSGWFWLESNHLQLFDWQTLRPDPVNGNMPNDIVIELYKADQPLVWIPICPQIQIALPGNLRAVKDKSKQSLWMPVDTSPNGEGLWIVFFLSEHLDESQENELEHLLPYLMDRCSEAVSSFYRIQRERLRSVIQFRECARELSCLDVNLLKKDEVLSGDNLVVTQLEIRRIVDKLYLYDDKFQSASDNTSELDSIDVRASFINVLETIHPWVEDNNLSINMHNVVNRLIYIQATSDNFEFVISTLLIEAVDYVSSIPKRHKPLCSISLNGEVGEDYYCISIKSHIREMREHTGLNNTKRDQSSKKQTPGAVLLKVKEIVKGWNGTLAMKFDEEYCASEPLLIELALPLWKERL